jgi:hypothetical protein
MRGLKVGDRVAYAGPTGVCSEVRLKAADFEAHKALEPRATSGFAILTI